MSELKNLLNHAPKLATAVLIAASGASIPVAPLDGKKFTLAEVQRFVGFQSPKGVSYVEAIRLIDGNLLLVDEDGRAKGLEVNEDASIIAGQVIVGNALIVKRGQF